MSADSPAWDRVRYGALAIGAACLAACALGGWWNPGLFLRSYLVAYNYWLGITLGSLAIVMVHHLTGGGWGLLIRRVLESETRTLPLLAILFLPILLGMGSLYPWAEPGAAAADPVLMHKSLYLNVPAFVGRAVAYFVLWIVLASLLNHWSRRQDAGDDPRLARKMRTLSGPGLVIYALTVTFAAIDWVMSLEPHWFSTIFAVVFGVAQALAALAFAVAMLRILAAEPALAPLISASRLRALGNLLLMLVMLWAYTAFSQFLLTWAGNLREEIVWYRPRMAGGWAWIAALLLACQFFLPFLLLLFRGVKDKLRHLAWVAAVILVTCFINLFWQIVPAFPPAGLSGHGLDFLAAVLAMGGVGGVWMALFLWHLKRRPLVPLSDPGLAEMVAHV